MRPAPSPESPHQTSHYSILIVPLSPSRLRSYPHGITLKSNWRLPPLVSFAAGIQYTILWAHAFIEMCIYCRLTDPPLYSLLLFPQCQPSLLRQLAPVVPPLAHPSLPPVPLRHVSQTPPAKGAPGKYPTLLTTSTFSTHRIPTEPIGTTSLPTTG
jgi:hypothetical protein